MNQTAFGEGIPNGNAPAAPAALEVLVVGPRLVCQALCTMVRRFAGVQSVRYLETPSALHILLQQGGSVTTRFALLLATTSGGALLDLPPLPTVVLRLESGPPASANAFAAVGNGRTTWEGVRPSVITLNGNADTDTLYRALCSVVGRSALVPLSAPTIAAPAVTVPAPQPAPEAPAKTSDRPWEKYGLSARQYEVTHLAASGLSNEEIAAKLFIAPSTVKFHLFEAFRQLGVKRRTQLQARLDSGSLKQ